MKNKFKVLVSQFPPLVFGDGKEFFGFEVDLWNSIAKDKKLNFEYREVPFQEMLNKLSRGEAEIGMAGLTITEQREKVVNFSHPTLDSGLAILIRKDRKRINVPENLKYFWRIGLTGIIKSLFWVLIFIFIFANLLWFAERGSGTFVENYFTGFFEASWMVISSMATEGYGDFVPHTWAGRIITIGVMIVGVAIFGLFVAQTSALATIKRIKKDIDGYNDLSGKKVVTVKGSSSVHPLLLIKADVAQVAKIEDAYSMLKNNEVDAVIFDAPVLKHYAEKEGNNNFCLAGDFFEKQNYGFAVFQKNTKLLEEVNQAILSLYESGEYDKIYKKWFGERT